MNIRLVLSLSPQLTHVKETETGSMPLESLSLLCDIFLARLAILK